MMRLPRARPLPGRLRKSLSRRAGRSERLASGTRGQFSGKTPALPLVLDVGVGTVAAGGGFGVPLAVGGLVLDRLGTAGHALLGGGALGGGECCGMGREGFRKNAVDGVGPAAVMLNDLVGDVGHRELAFLSGRARPQ